MTEYIIEAKDGDKFRKELLRKRRIAESGRKTEKWESTILNEIIEQIKNEVKTEMLSLIKPTIENQQKLTEAVNRILDFLKSERKQELKKTKEKAKPKGIVHAETETPLLDKRTLERLRKYDLSTPEGVRAYLKEAELNETKQ